MNRAADRARQPGKIYSVVRNGKLRRVEQVERFSAEFELHRFLELKILKDGEIEVVLRGAAQDATSGVAVEVSKGLAGSEGRINEYAGRNLPEGERIVPALQGLFVGGAKVLDLQMEA